MRRIDHRIESAVHQFSRDYKIGVQRLVPFVVLLVCIIVFDCRQANADYQFTPAQQKQIQEIKALQAKEKEFERKDGQLSDDELAGRDAAAGDTPDLDKAIPLLKKALEESKQLYGVDHFKTGWEWDCLGEAYGQADNPEQAEKCFQQAMLVYNSLSPPDREQINHPANALWALLQGRINGMRMLSKGAYTDWIGRCHSSKSERDQLIDKLDHIRMNPMEKAALDQSWGSLPADTPLKQYLVQVQQLINKQWKAPPNCAGCKGKVIISASIVFDTTVKLEEKSGSSAFDEAILKAAQSIKRYPLPGERGKITLCVSFASNGAELPFEIFNNL